MGLSLPLDSAYDMLIQKISIALATFIVRKQELFHATHFV